MAILAFKIGELSRKMQAAVSALDFETAIPLRDEMRKLQDQLDAEVKAAERPKVIDFRTREGFDPPVEKPARKRKQKEPAYEPNPEEIELLNDLLEGVKKGEYGGIVAFFGISASAKGACDTVACSSSELAWDHMQQFVGAMEEAKFDFLSLNADEEWDGDDPDDGEEVPIIEVPNDKT